MDRHALTLGASLAAAVADAPDRPFVVWEGRDLSYRAFDERSNQAARAWQQLGISRGDRVAFMMENHPDFVIGWFGLAKIGATLVAVNNRFQAEEAAYVLDDASVTVVLTDARCQPVIEEVQRSSVVLDTVLGVTPEQGLTTLASLMDEQPVTPVTVAVGGEDLVSIIYTSGSTGRPKGVMQPHANFVLTGQAYIDWFRMTSDDRAYVSLPLYHVNAQAYSTMSTIEARSTIVLAPRFSASRFWDDIRTQRVTMFNFIGAMMSILARDEPSPNDADNQVRIAYSASVGSLSLERRKELEERYGLRLLTGFGMSETTFGFIEPFEGERRQGSIGLLRQHPNPSVPRTEARIVDGDGHDVATGDVGELLLRSCAMMTGYLNDPERTAQALEDGWLHTGDLVRADEDGYFYFVDRQKDVIRVRGENVASVEVERLIATHPDVDQCSVIGVPSELTEEDILAVILPVPGRNPDPAEIWTWVEQRVARFKVPRYVRFVDDLPRTGSQKISKPELRKQFEASGDWGHDRQDHEVGGARDTGP